MKRIHPFFMVLLITLTISCGKQTSELELKTGDLLFQGASSSSLSEAINRVTQTEKATNYSHVGLVEVDADGQIFVLHADTDSGSARINLFDFLHRTNDSIQSDLYRLKPEWQNSIPEAIDEARKMLGKPYNFSYIMNDSSHYCSEFVYRAFQTDSVFSLNPMTFRDPETGDFYPTWVKFYSDLALPIPEGFPGCNPNGMAASERLTRIGNVVWENGRAQIVR